MYPLRASRRLQGHSPEPPVPINQQPQHTPTSANTSHASSVPVQSINSTSQTSSFWNTNLTQRSDRTITIDPPRPPTIAQPVQMSTPMNPPLHASQVYQPQPAIYPQPYYGYPPSISPIPSLSIHSAPNSFSSVHQTVPQPIPNNHNAHQRDPSVVSVHTVNTSLPYPSVSDPPSQVTLFPDLDQEQRKRNPSTISGSSSTTS